MEHYKSHTSNNIPACIQQNWPRFLIILCDPKTTVQERKKELQNCPVEMIKCLIVCASNILRGNFDLTKKDIEKIRRFKKLFYFLDSPANCIKAKRKRLVSYAADLPKIYASLVKLIEVQCSETKLK